MIKQQRFAPHGMLALNPVAFGLVVECGEPSAPAMTSDGVAVVAVRGPLMHRAEFFFDSYESIKARVAAALALGPRAVLLDVDSPGGLVSGVFDCARELRAMAAAARVPLRAYVGAQATSAAYALASAAGEIYVSASATIGSIGVIDMLIDQTMQNQMLGLNVRLVTSGTRKADGQPNSPITDDSLAATQAKVNTLATMFFELVVEHGWGGSVDSLRALQASVMTGGEAVKVKLATAIASYDQAIALASAADSRPRSRVTAKGPETMDKEKEAAIAALRKMVAGDDPEMSKSARAALTALGVEDDEPADEPESSDEPADEPAAADEPADEPESSDEPKPAAASGDALSMAAQALASVHRLEVKIAREQAASERVKLLASRPDFAPELVKVLRSAPMATVREMCRTLPRGAARKDRAAAGVAGAPAQPAATRGQGQGDGSAARLPATEKAELDARMGLSSMASATVHTPHTMSFGVQVPAPVGTSTK